MDDQIILADKKLRKQVLIGILLCIPVGGFLICFMSGYFEECKDLAATDTELAVSKIRNFLTLISIINAFISSAFALYFISVGIRSFKSEIYPPEGMRVVKDTKIMTGKKAKGMAMGHILMAVILLFSNGLMWYLRVIVDTLLSR